MGDVVLSRPQPEDADVEIGRAAQRPGDELDVAALVAGVERRDRALAVGQVDGVVVEVDPADNRARAHSTATPSELAPTNLGAPSS